MPEEDARAPVEVYRSYLKEGRLGFQRCRGCRSAIFYPRVLCPVCGSTSLAWETSGGRGTGYTTTAYITVTAIPTTSPSLISKRVSG